MANKKVVVSKQMNVLLWVLQILLAFWFITGGIYMVNNYQDLAKEWALNALPYPFWLALGSLQVLFALGLVLPGLLKVSRKLTYSSAIGLTIIALLGISLYVAFTGSGILWGLLPAILAAFVAYGRRE